MNSKILKSREFLSIFFSVIIFVIIFFLSEVFGLFSGINERISNNLTKISYIFKENTVNENIVVVTIDEKTLAKLGRFPFGREHYSKVIENLNEAGVSVIGMDIIFADEDKNNKQSDKKFAESIKKYGNVVLGGGFYSENIGNKNVTLIEKPLDIFYENVLGFGYFQPNLSENNVVNTFTPFQEIADKTLAVSKYNQFSISLLKAYYGKIYGKNFNDFFKADSSKIYLRPNDNVGIPYSYKGRKDILINFLPVPKNKLSAFPVYSFIDVYELNLNPEIFRDKIVIIGATAKGIKDIFTTNNGIEYGVFVQANILNMILTKNFLVYFDEYLEWGLIFLLLVVSFYFSLSRSGFIIFFSNISIAIIFLLIYPSIVIIFSGYVLNHIFELFLSLPFAIAIGNSIKYLFENKNKAKLSKALSEYVSKAIVNEILSNSGDVKLDGELRKLTIFFSDIEGFTSISEKFSPQDLVSFLRDYLSNMSNIILDNKGFINKYEGDAIMALWGSFSYSEKDSFYACLSAVKQQELLKELNKIWCQTGLPEIRARIGLHTGQAIVGNIGAVGRKLEYTALGDSVNLASRLEGVNKFYGTFICVSENVYEENKDLFEFRYLDIIQVKGKDKAIKIYELLSLKGELDKTKKEIIEKCSIAMEEYKNRNFENAKKLFENIFENFGDSPSKTYIERCEFYMKNPPEATGEIIWKFDSK